MDFINTQQQSLLLFAVDISWVKRNRLVMPIYFFFHSLSKAVVIVTFQTNVFAIPQGIFGVQVLAITFTGVPSLCIKYLMLEDI